MVTTKKAIAAVDDDETAEQKLTGDGKGRKTADTKAKAASEAKKAATGTVQKPNLKNAARSKTPNR
ncbi:MAG: hypothetical protein ABIU09_11010 [Pyrinomonadaceae bacterium]